jgi:hypothetical protein
VDDQNWFAVRTLFWILAAAAVFLPMRWSILSFILISHIDVTTSTFESATSVGFENSVRTVVLPTLLFIRFSRGRLLNLRWNAPVVLWVLLTLYAAAACLWTPFQLSGVKMIGYMYCYLVLGAVFLDGWNRGVVTPSLIAAALWLSLLMGVVQTYALGNQFGKWAPGLEDERFTSFCSPQLFGAFILAMMSILFVTSRQRLWAVCLHGLGGFSGIVLCGSRYVFLGSLVLVLIVVVSHVVRQPTAKKHAARVIAGMAGLIVGTFLLAGVLYADQENRISQLVATVLEGKSPLDNIGTLVWRRAVYDQTWTALVHRGPAELAVGSGTSSGALAVIGWDRRYLEASIDANRVVHNELLRVIFEWGFIGLAFFVAFLGCVIRMFVHLAVSRRIMPAYAFLSLLPTVILGCCSENILAGSASPAGVGFLLSMMYGICYQQRRSAQSVLIDRSRTVVEVGSHPQLSGA